MQKPRRMLIPPAYNYADDRSNPELRWLLFLHAFIAAAKAPAKWKNRLYDALLLFGMGLVPRAQEARAKHLVIAFLTRAMKLAGSEEPVPVDWIEASFEIWTKTGQVLQIAGTDMLEPRLIDRILVELDQEVFEGFVLLVERTDIEGWLGRIHSAISTLEERRDLISDTMAAAHLDFIIENCRAAASERSN